jgi:succinate dehydrogenase hydrophobic anchor subunit
MTGDAAPPPVPPTTLPPVPPVPPVPVPPVPPVPVPPVPPTTTRTTTRSGRTRQLLGLLVAVLLLGHLLPLFVAGRGVSRLDWNVMAARWASPFGRSWDLLTVWATFGYAALLVRERVRGRRDRRMFGIACAAIILAGLAVGTMAVVGFDADLR